MKLLIQQYVHSGKGTMEVWNISSGIVLKFKCSVEIL